MDKNAGDAMEARHLETALATARVVIGAALLAAPGVFGRAWIGRDATRPAVQAAMRAVGVREVGLGLGTVLARRHGRATRGWVEAGALADLGDAVATALAWRYLPSPHRAAVVTAAGGAAAVGVVLARMVGDESRPTGGRA